MRKPIQHPHEHFLNPHSLILRILIFGGLQISISHTSAVSHYLSTPTNSEDSLRPTANQQTRFWMPHRPDFRIWRAANWRKRVNALIEQGLEPTSEHWSCETPQGPEEIVSSLSPIRKFGRSRRVQFRAAPDVLPFLKDTRHFRSENGPALGQVSKHGESSPVSFISKRRHFGGEIRGYIVVSYRFYTI